MICRRDEMRLLLLLRADDKIGIINMPVQCKYNIRLISPQHIRHLLRTALLDFRPYPRIFTAKLQKILFKIAIADGA